MYVSGLGSAPATPPQEEPPCVIPAGRRTLPQRSRVLRRASAHRLGSGALLKVLCSYISASWMQWPLLWSVFRHLWKFQVSSPLPCWGYYLRVGNGVAEACGAVSRRRVPAVCCPAPETRLVIRREPRPLLPWGQLSPLGPLFGHTQAFEVSRLPEGLGLIPNPHSQRGLSAWPRLPRSFSARRARPAGSSRRGT